MYKYATFAANVTNEAAKAFMLKIRQDCEILHKVYTITYLRKLAEVCKYNVDGCNKTIQIQRATVKQFKNNKEMGEFMESTINDLFALGIKK